MSENVEGPVQKVAELIDGIRFAMVTSRTTSGALVSRPLTVQQTDFDGDLWFFVDAQADLLDQIRAEPRVNAALTGDGTWVSLSGVARVVEDPARAEELWSPMTAAWFSGEGSSDSDAKDPGPAELGAVLVTIDGDTAEYWEGSGKVATAVSLVKARLTGSDIDVGSNDTVELP